MFRLSFESVVGIFQIVIIVPSLRN